MGRGRLTPPQRHPRRQPRRENETENPRTTHHARQLRVTPALPTFAQQRRANTPAALPSRTRLPPEAKTEPNPKAKTGTENSPTPQHAKPRTTRSTLHADLGPATPRREDEHPHEPSTEPKPGPRLEAKVRAVKAAPPSSTPRTVNRYGSLLPPPRRQEARSMSSWLANHPPCATRGSNPETTNRTETRNGNRNGCADVRVVPESVHAQSRTVESNRDPKRKPKR